MLLLRDVPSPGEANLYACTRGEIWAFRGDEGDSFNQRWTTAPAMVPDEMRNDEVRWPKPAGAEASGSHVYILSDGDEGEDEEHSHD